MANAYFQFENDPLKHHVRANLWLPFCKERLEALKKGDRKRRLRYFTFCGAGAVDVLMLNVHKILSTSAQDKFDTVTFFDRSPDAVSETIKNIPGASGFPGDFTSTVLAASIGDEESAESDPLSPPEIAPDTLEVESGQIQQGQQTRFISRFPFDVINLDLEELIFKKRQPPPGRIINTLRTIFRWQKRKVNGTVYLNEFTLFFTTQVGPRNLPDDYVSMLVDCVQSNVQMNPSLKTAFQARVSHDDPRKLFNDDFDSFYRIAVPKILVKVLNETDWHIDPENGIAIYEFERPASNGSYKILHLGMHVQRMHPPQEKRMPGAAPQGHIESYTKLAARIFTDSPISVSMANVDVNSIQKDLIEIDGRRKKYANL